MNLNNVCKNNWLITWVLREWTSCTLQDNEDVDHHHQHEEVGEHHHARHAAADGQAVAGPGGLAELEVLLLLLGVGEAVAGEGAVPAQQQHPQDGEGHGEDDEEAGQHEGGQQVLGGAGVDLVGGGVVPGHVHLGPATRQHYIWLQHNSSTSPRQHELQVDAPRQLGNVDRQPGLGDDHAEVHGGEAAVGVGHVGHHGLVHHHAVHQDGA